MKKIFLGLTLAGVILLASCSGQGKVATPDATGETLASSEEGQGFTLPENMSYAKLKKGVAITVDGDEISQKEFDHYFDILKKQFISMYGEKGLNEKGQNGLSQEEMLRLQIEERLILQHLMKKELGNYKVKEEDIDKILKLIKEKQGEENIKKYFEEVKITEEDYRDVLAQTVVEDEHFNQYKAKNKVSDDQAKSFYILKKAELTSYKASHILVDTEEEAKEILKELKAGKDFATLAKEKSKDPGSAQNGGDLGYQPASAYVPEFGNALKALKVGEYSEPVKSQHGYHIIHLEDIKDSYEDWEEQIKMQITHDNYQMHISELFSKAKIKLQEP